MQRPISELKQDCPGIITHPNLPDVDPLFQSARVRARTIAAVRERDEELAKTTDSETDQSRPLHALSDVPQEELEVMQRLLKERGNTSLEGIGSLPHHKLMSESNTGPDTELAYRLTESINDILDTMRTTESNGSSNFGTPLTADACMFRGCG